jgi:hypothetical protein
MTEKKRERLLTLAVLGISVFKGDRIAFLELEQRAQAMQVPSSTTRQGA